MFFTLNLRLRSRQAEDRPRTLGELNYVCRLSDGRDSISIIDIVLDINVRQLDAY